MKNKVEVKCPRCKHKFLTKSNNLVNCNECGLKFRKDDNLTAPKEQKKLEGVELENKDG